MEQYIPKEPLVAEIERLYQEHSSKEYIDEGGVVLCQLEDFLDTLEVKEVDNTPNIRFPHYKSIVEKVFGAGNLESFEYNEAEQLVSLAKEELLKDLEVKEVDLEKIKRDWRNKGYIEGRKQALIPARKLGLPKSLNIIDMEEVKDAAKEWTNNSENINGCDYIGATVAEHAFIACAEWLINKAQKGE